MLAFAWGGVAIGTSSSGLLLQCLFDPNVPWDEHIGVGMFSWSLFGCTFGAGAFFGARALARVWDRSQGVPRL